jgi:hypothetical protein
MTAAQEAAYVAGDSSAAQDDFDRVGGQAGIAALTGQLIRHRVVVAVDLDVVIDVHGRRLPDRELVAPARQRSQGQPLELLEQAQPAALQLLDGSGWDGSTDGPITLSRFATSSSVDVDQETGRARLSYRRAEKVFQEGSGRPPVCPRRPCR